VSAGAKDPLILALDTATRRASVAICRGSDVLAEGSREVTTHSEGLMPLVDEMLRQSGVATADLDAVVCGVGPGSFTGLRIGMATAKGLCFAAGKPLYGVSSLQALALGAGEGLVAAVLDARRREVYLGLYRDGEPLMSELVCAPSEVARRLPLDPGSNILLAGDGALAYRELLLSSLEGAALAVEGRHDIEARDLARAALSRIAAGDADDLAAVVPLYIRPSDAKLPAVPQDRRPVPGEEPQK
jgi:tRNA threonylcarbamoyladenosine biosynthesis protein TsaB